jgi:hypothetical protein
MNDDGCWGKNPRTAIWAGSCANLSGGLVVLEGLRLEMDPILFSTELVDSGAGEYEPYSE